MAARGYCRVSTTMQAEDGESLETQQKSIQDYCNHKNLKLIKFYIDAGLSGGTLNRDAIQELFKEIQPGETFIVTNLSRLSRNTADSLSILEKFKNMGVVLVCLNPNMDFTTPLGELTYTLLSAVYKMERANIAMHVKANLNQLSQEGKLRTVPPFGWRFVSKELPFQPVPEQQLVLEKIKRLYSEGMNYSQIARRLNEDKDNLCLSLNKKKKDLSRVFESGTIKRILINNGLIPDQAPLNKNSLDQRITCHREK